MKYVIEKNGRPAYLQIYEQLKRDIICGSYSAGSKLPSKRLLAEETGASVITVEHAYDILIEEGYIDARERSGFFVVFRKQDGFASSAPAPLLSARPAPFHSEGFPFSVLSKTMRRVLCDQGERLFERSPNAGYTGLCEALRLYLSRNRDMDVDADQIVIGSGAEYLYGLIIELLGRDRKYAIEYPSYEKIEQVYRAEEVDCLCLPLSGDGIGREELFSSEADVLHVTPYRSYPTGVTASASKRHEYIEWANAADRYIIEDDFGSEFSVSTKPVDTLFALSTDQNVIYLNTFSKTISPSLRVGYMVLPKKLVPLFRQKLGFYSCTVPTYEQAVLAELISCGDFERHINRVRRALRKAANDRGTF